MSFEVRAVESAEEDPVISRFTDKEWWNLTALAHECGFDAGREHERLVYPGGSDTHELNDRVSRQLRAGVEAVLKQDVLPFATTWEADDGHIHFRWAEPPEYGRDHVSVGQDETGEGSDFRIKGAKLHRLMEHLIRRPVIVTRVAPED